MKNESKPNVIDSDFFLDLNQVFLSIKKSKYFIVAGFLVGAFVTGAAAFFMENKYTSEATLIVSQVENGELSRDMPKLGGLLDLANMGLSNRGVAEINVAKLKSRDFVIRFINDRDLKKALFPKRWDEIKSEWVDSSSWFGSVQHDSSGPPKDLAVYDYFMRRVIDFDFDVRKSTLELRATTSSPELSKNILDELIHGVNEHIRNRKIEESERYIKYLEKELSRAGSIELEKVLYDLLEKQVKIRMVSSLDEDYAFEIIDNPYLPIKSSGPGRFTIVVVGGVMSIFLAMLYVVIKERNSDE